MGIFEDLDPHTSSEAETFVVGAERQETPKILRGLSFILSSETTTPFGVVRGKKFINSLPGRKIVILDQGQPEPELGRAYDVEVIKDTKPFDPARGALIVRYVRGAGMADAQEPEGGDISVPIEEKAAHKEKYVPPPVEVDKEAGSVYVAETRIPLNPEGGKLVPSPDRFRHFTIDEPTLEVLEKIATAVELREPCLLEGETSTSKTSAIEYLAMMSNNEIVRLNLNGQTDTSELIGKFVPNDGQLKIAFEELLRNFDILSERSKAILDKANSDGRGLTLIESQQIAQAEGLKVPDWHWQDGLDVQAKKKGQWLILDEMNFAEPQILERLNSQLEKDPSITLSENGGVVIRELDEREMASWKKGQLSGVDPLHPNFRIFSTGNPEYVGRQPFSPAYKDRWTSYKHVNPPTAVNYTAMMNFMVFGEQPEIVLHGAKYKAPNIQEQILPTLGQIPNFRGFMAKLAKFQEAIEGLSRRREIGRGKKEPYIFTRRGIIEFLHYLEQKIVVDRKKKKRVSIKEVPEMIISRAIQYYYLDKISSADDLKKVKDQLDALGIGEHWTHQFKSTAQ